MNFNISLNDSELGTVLSALGKLPYETVAPLYSNVVQQAQFQQQEAKSAKEDDGAKEPSPPQPKKS